ncbi:MAG: hypothetical protein QM779_08595 [Propionicimonas sp.]|uniref:hypothetical protein n=1 Tax=Propionicimonas sp. TaxID=1955623 RepID=UPI003D0E970D
MSSRDWPRDPRLDPFRDTVWELSTDGRVVAHLVCRVMSVRHLWARREQLWYRVCWPDGRRERALLDSGPVWSVLADLEKGRFELLDVQNRVYEARPAPAVHQPDLWARYGPS